MIRWSKVGQLEEERAKSSEKRLANSLTLPLNHLDFVYIYLRVCEREHIYARTHVAK